MTVPAPEAPAPARLDPDSDDIVHLTCCSPDVAMCGEDVEGDKWVADEDDTPECLFCVFVCDNDLPCTVPGCWPVVR